MTYIPIRHINDVSQQLWRETLERVKVVFNRPWVCGFCARNLNINQTINEFMIASKEIFVAATSEVSHETTVNLTLNHSWRMMLIAAVTCCVVLPRSSASFKTFKAPSISLLGAILSKKREN